MTHRLPLLLFGLTLTFTGLQGKEPKLDKQKIEQNTRLQIFLDNANFGPGKLDGQGGEFTKKALALYNRSIGQPETTEPDLSSVEPVFTTYAIAQEDLANVGSLPSGPAAQAKVKRLPYASVLEGIAEKFHTDLAFLKQLNPGTKGKLGDQLTVPNVKPFELSAVKAIQPGAAAAQIIANDLGEEKDAAPEATPAADSKAESKTDSKPEDAKLTLYVSVKEELVEVRNGDKTVAAFPVTVGSQQTASPIGKWTVKGVAKMPDFRYDAMMLKKGERSKNFHILPPGPNNPVGVVWIALNKRGIGLHGTESPDTIGRSASHGCIRLANWDIVKLAEMVKAGVAVTVE